MPTLLDQKSNIQLCRLFDKKDHSSMRVTTIKSWEIPLKLASGAGENMIWLKPAHISSR